MLSAKRQLLFYRMKTSGGVETQPAGSELRDQEHSSKHGNVLQKHSHLNLRHHWIFHCPEVVHHEGDPNQEEH